MNFEQFPTKNPIETSEIESGQDSLSKKALSILDHMDLPNKEKLKKFVASTLSGLAAITAVEAQNIDNSNKLDIKERFSPEMQTAITRTDIKKPANIDLELMAAYLNIPKEQIKELVAHTLSQEANDEGVVHTESQSGIVPEEADDIFFTSKTVLAVGAEEKYGTSPILYDGMRADTRVFTFNGMEIDPVGEPKNFEGSGATKSEAILAALEDGIGFTMGVKVGTQKELTSYSDEKNISHTDDTAEADVEYSEKFVDLSHRYVEGFVDHYKVIDITKDEDGLYKAKVEITFGQRPQFQLPDGVELVQNNSPYYEINPDTQDNNSK
jgi:hypothetical protein